MASQTRRTRTPIPAPEFYTAEDLARIAQITPRSLHRALYSANRPDTVTRPKSAPPPPEDRPSVKHPLRWRASRPDVREWIEARTGGYTRTVYRSDSRVHFPDRTDAGVSACGKTQLAGLESHDAADVPVEDRCGKLRCAMLWEAFDAAEAAAAAEGRMHLGGKAIDR